MKIALYSPFLADNIGGGERYLLTVAECLLARHQVDLVLSPDKVNPGDLNKLKNHFVKGFNLNLKNLHLVLGPFSPQASARQRAAFTKAYDVFYYMTDGSFFIPQGQGSQLPIYPKGPGKNLEDQNRPRPLGCSRP